MGSREGGVWHPEKQSSRCDENCKHSPSLVNSTEKWLCGPECFLTALLEGHLAGGMDACQLTGAQIFTGPNS